MRSRTGKNLGQEDGGELKILGHMRRWQWGIQTTCVKCKKRKKG